MLSGVAWGGGGEATNDSLPASHPPLLHISVSPTLKAPASTRIMSTAAAAAASDAVLLGDNEASGSSSSSLLAKPRRSHTLMTLPPEILDSIAYFCAITTYHHVRTSSECSNCLDGDLDMCTNCQLDYSSPAPAYATPPANVRALLLTCRRAHALLNTQANPRLYARLFKIKFDVAAIKRRFGSQAVSSRSLTMELQRRCVCLKRIKEAVEQGRLRPRAEEETNDAQYEAQWLAESNSQMLENLWLAYMMMVENGESSAESSPLIPDPGFLPSSLSYAMHRRTQLATASLGAH